MQRDLADIQDLHRSVMSAFPQTNSSTEARARLGVLYRLEMERSRSMPVLFVQSREVPDWKALPPRYLSEASGLENPACKPVDGPYGRLRTGVALRFRLRANPSKKAKPESGAGNSKRVELRGEDDQLAWLQRKGEQSGFRLLPAQPGSSVFDTRVVPEAKLLGQKPGQGSSPAQILVVGAVLFEGALEVTDADLFRRALEEGIGPGKAYGCGLLSVAPLRS